MLRRIRWRRLRRVFSRILALSLVLWILASFLLAGTISIYGQQDGRQEADVIIVLGAGSAALQRRAGHAAFLWHSDFAPYLICTGGVDVRYRQTEADYCRRILIQEGVPATDIFLERSSRSTEGNAIYASQIMAEHEWETAIIVTDDYHLWRAHWIFTQKFEEKGWRLYTSPAQSTQPEVPKGEWTFAVLREVGATYWHLTKSVPILSQ
ncbi:MAG: YdcF family protein [Chloroflexi bacterium]|nr:YdcF family protein [Chloroflexota bacterium]